MATKRITIPVNVEIDTIREIILKETGIRMNYVQLFSYLIHFYMKHHAEPVTKWASMTIKEGK